jgi:hypothetical protein
MPVRSDVHVIPGAGHSYETGKAGKEQTSDEMIDEINRVILGWLDSL